VYKIRSLLAIFAFLLPLLFPSISIALQDDNNMVETSGQVTGIDNDDDGFFKYEDCDDSDNTVNPSAAEVCDDGADNDCNGREDMEDEACRPSFVLQEKVVPKHFDYGEYLGPSLSISGSYAIVGSSCIDENGNDSSFSYIFERDISGNWQKLDKLATSDVESGDCFGISVSISDGYAIVGSALDDDLGDNSGSAYIFERDITGNWQEAAKLTASDGNSEDNFGFPVSISGNYAIIGSDSDYNGQDFIGSGSAYIFERDSTGNWREVSKLTPSDGVNYDLFGSSVSISGSYAIVGSSNHDGLYSNSGCSYIYERDTTGNWQEMAKLTASDGAEYDNFGMSVSISGNYVIVGSPFSDGNGINSGSAYIYERDTTGNWQEVAKLTASDNRYNSFFGYSVSISNGYAIVGSPGDSINMLNFDSSGSSYIFERDLFGNWQQLDKLFDKDRIVSHWFGWRVSISGNNVFVGTQWQQEVYVFNKKFPQIDIDGDGFSEVDDCNDLDSSVYPGNKEICGNHIDNNCNGRINEGCDLDNDGFLSQDDCDDFNGKVYPGAVEICRNGIDDNCDGSVDEGCSSGS